MQDGVVAVVVFAIPLLIVTASWAAFRRAEARDQAGSPYGRSVDTRALTRAYKLSGAAAAASWVLVAASFWAPGSQVWTTTGILLNSLSALVQFRADGRRSLAKLSLWLTALSVACVATALLAFALAPGEAGPSLVRAGGQVSGGHGSPTTPHNHAD